MDKQQLISSLKEQGFPDKIVRAFEKVRREDFVPASLKNYSYEDEPLPIGEGQTISQPYTIAFMLDLLELDKIDNKEDFQDENIKLQKIKSKQQNNKSIRNECVIDYNINKNKPKILEVGSGSGYVLKLIRELTRELETKIFGIERIKELYERSKEVLKDKKNIKIFFGDGTKGLKEKAPFNRILVSASANKIPKELINQLKVGGILVIPVKNSIICLKKEYGENKISEYPGFVFVPLVEDK